MKDNVLPSMFINTDNNDFEYLESDKHTSDSGYISIVDSNGDIEYSDKLEKISGRGNGTWDMYKKGWSLTLNDDCSLLGMKKSKNWILLPNGADDTGGLRNYSAYNMALNCGLDTTSCLKFVELYIDGDYRGLYQIAERIEESEEKLDIGDLDKQNNKANKVELSSKTPIKNITNNDGTIIKQWSDIESPDDITGGYILERNYGDKLIDKTNYFITDNDEGFVVRYPEYTSKEEMYYISDIMQNIENAIYSDDYIDPNTGKYIFDLIDLDSWAMKYLVDEITKNEGAASTSSYYYKKQGDDLIYGGPIWDYDKSFGNYRLWIDPEGLTFSNMHPVDPCDWYLRLCGNEEFRNRVIELYIEVFRPYLIQLEDALIDSWTKQIEEGYLMNYYRWKNDLVNVNESLEVDNEYFKDIKNTTEYLKDWIEERIDFLDDVCFYEEDD